MSTPLFDPDDPRLTAYALGEATADERQAVELILAASPEARATVEETRVLARGLEEDFARENAAYQRAHARPVIATNVIPFPGASRRRWRPAAVLAWKLAAVFVAVGSLVWIVGRRTSPGPIASVQHPAPTEALPATPAESPEPAGNVNQSLAAAAPTEDVQTDEAKAEARSVAPAAAEPPPAASLQAPGSAEGLFADAAKPEARGAGATFDKAQQAPGESRAASAPIAAQPPRLAAARMAPAPAAPKKTETPTTEERLTAALVRVRFGDRTFAGGVLLSADGWLVVGPQSSKGMPTLNGITLADGRELHVAGYPADPETGKGLLRVDATGLSHVALASEPPTEGDRLVVANFDAKTGDVSFTDTLVARSGERTYINGPAGKADLVFNAAGELLAVERPAFSTTPESNAKAIRRAAPTLFAVRAYTADERAMLKRLTK